MLISEELLAKIEANVVHRDHNGVSVVKEDMVKIGNELVEKPGHIYYITHEDNQLAELSFQLGAVLDNGVNGITNEALLALLIHRTKMLDIKFPCEENVLAITHMQNALLALEARTHRRILRNVEGHHVA